MLVLRKEPLRPRNWVNLLRNAVGGLSATCRPLVGHLADNHADNIGLYLREHGHVAARAAGRNTAPYPVHHADHETEGR